MARKYKHGGYIFPPRPEYKIKSESLGKYDDGSFYAQPKMNGSNCTIYLDGKTFEQRNRHEGIISNFKLKDSDILPLHKGEGDFVIVGEYMNKSQKDINGKVFNNKFVIFDILVFNGMQLVGTTYKERYKMMIELFGIKSYDDYLYQISDTVFMVKSFEKDFKTLYEKIIKIDMLEGWVLKKKTGKLERGSRLKNNLGWQLKCRRSSANYQF